MWMVEMDDYWMAYSIYWVEGERMKYGFRFKTPQITSFTKMFCVYHEGKWMKVE